MKRIAVLFMAGALLLAAAEKRTSSEASFAFSTRAFVSALASASSSPFRRKAASR